MQETAPAYMTDLRRWIVIRAILGSFEPDWSDRDLFVAYGGLPSGTTIELQWKTFRFTLLFPHLHRKWPLYGHQAPAI